RGERNVAGAGLKIATFNVENLLTRYDFRGRKARGRGLFGLMKRLGDRRMATGRSDASRFELDEADRLATAYAIRDLNADVLFLQEVESEAVLADFEKNYLRPLKLSYPNRIVLDGNDLRGIDVAAMARDGIDLNAKSHHAITYADAGVYDNTVQDLGIRPKERVFKRDCLEVDVSFAGTSFAAFVCHFKSMRMSRFMERKFGSGADARLVTAPIRRAEAKTVRRVIEDRFGGHAKEGAWVVCGDFNDHLFANGDRFFDFSAAALVADGFSHNVIERLARDHRWTHFYSPETKFSQLDYILLSPALAASNKTAKPSVLRSGMPLRVPSLTDVDRYDGIGWDRPKSSDHCPVVFDLKIR
ncbi:MAG: endonuclease/exonuclease/phosphatase family protein, partial [Pseudomonadota bacterium]